jgi:Golgi SNAP receptor complex protein 1
MPTTSTEYFDHLTWDDLAKLAKHSETDLDNKLLQLGRLTSSALRSHRYDGLRPGNDALRQAEGLAEEVEGLLRKLGEIIDGLTGRGGEAGNLHLIQRHRDILAEYSSEFRKTKVSLPSLADDP